MFKCKFQSMQGSAGFSPERPLRQQEGMSHPPVLSPRSSQVQERLVWGVPWPAQVRRPQCGSLPAPRALVSPRQAPTAAEDAGPCGRAPPGHDAVGVPAAAPAGPPHNRCLPATGCTAICRRGAASTGALVSWGSCVTPRSFSGEMFHLYLFSLLKTGRLLRILVRNKNKTDQTITETGPARREVAPGPPRQAARCRRARLPSPTPALPRARRRLARYSPSGPPRRGDPTAPGAASPRRRSAPTSARSGGWRGAKLLGDGGRGQRDRRASGGQEQASPGTAGSKTTAGPGGSANRARHGTRGCPMPRRRSKTALSKTINF